MKYAPLNSLLVGVIWQFLEALTKLRFCHCQIRYPIPLLFIKFSCSSAWIPNNSVILAFALTPSVLPVNGTPAMGKPHKQLTSSNVTVINLNKKYKESIYFTSHLFI